MRNAVLGSLFIAGLWMASVGIAPGRERLSASAASPVEGCGQELITLSTPAGDNRQMLTIVDPRTRAVAVYHVDVPSGAITLKGVRNINWDLQMVEYNGVSPLPGELRSLLGQK
jgi:hypothetical protein